jgi:quercetin dioxygenase-like cupin family protein
VRIVDFQPALAQPVTEFHSRAATALEIAMGRGEAHAVLLHFEPGGLIGPHPAGFAQLYAPLIGSGWIAGVDGARQLLRPGRVAVVDRGELHSKGSDEGMTAVMVQVRELAHVP